MDGNSYSDSGDINRELPYSIYFSLGYKDFLLLGYSRVENLLQFIETGGDGFGECRGRACPLPHSESRNGRLR